ncbi:hypothetical protein [Mycobacterium sp. OTB74]|nr:hypothetical protein [Mycobacterium sp. OTB74]MDH6247570.1 hypothetical protein [Mycobacterium sp. OTB74]
MPRRTAVPENVRANVAVRCTAEPVTVIGRDSYAPAGYATVQFLNG